MSTETSTTGKSKWAARRASMKPQPITTSQDDWVEEAPLEPGESLPLVLRPKMRSLDVYEWVRGHREELETKLRHHGGLLFRDFGLRGDADFHAFLEALGSPLMHYTEGATPRSKISDKVYTSTEFPADQTIAPHNELNYVVTWPMKIWFYCVIAAEEGGETPIVDVRKVYQRLSPETREKFEDKGWMLVRNFGDGFGPSWQSSYRVETREQAEEYFRRSDIQWTWRDGDRLRTSQVRPAVARHLETGEMCWFNHVAFWHVSSLEPRLREMFLDELGEENLPYNTYYGDGSEIEDEVAQELRDAYDAELVAFPWQEGDLLMLDNMLVAHGRKPFRGDRKILTAMAEPRSDRNL